MNAKPLIVLMVFMMNVNADIQFHYGASLDFVLIICLLVPLLNQEYYACMVV